VLLLKALWICCVDSCGCAGNAGGNYTDDEADAIGDRANYDNGDNDWERL
jgi:hypothetical protein